MKNVNSLLCTLVVGTLFLCNAANAQYQVDRNYAAKTIYLKGNKFIKDGIEYPNGFLFQNLKNEMKISPYAVIEYKQYERKRNTGILLAITGTVCAVYALQNYANGNEKKGNRLLIGSLGANLISIPFTIKASNHFHKAIWIRNGDALNN